MADKKRKSRINLKQIDLLKTIKEKRIKNQHQIYEKRMRKMRNMIQFENIQASELKKEDIIKLKDAVQSKNGLALNQALSNEMMVIYCQRLIDGSLIDAFLDLFKLLIQFPQTAEKFVIHGIFYQLLRIIHIHDALIIIEKICCTNVLSSQHVLALLNSLKKHAFKIDINIALNLINSLLKNNKKLISDTLLIDLLIDFIKIYLYTNDEQIFIKVCQIFTIITKKENITKIIDSGIIIKLLSIRKPSLFNVILNLLLELLINAPHYKTFFINCGLKEFLIEASQQMDKNVLVKIEKIKTFLFN